MYAASFQDAERAASSLQRDPIIAGHQTTTLLQVVQMASWLRQGLESTSMKHGVWTCPTAAKGQSNIYWGDVALKKMLW